MKTNNLFSKLFVDHKYFTIAIKSRNKTDLLKSHTFTPNIVFEACYKNWQADPILIESGDKTYMFYEKVIDGKGHIEAVEIFDNCIIGLPHIILESETHYSYPFVFMYNSEWYMIPESSELNEVRLYKSTCFPYKWELKEILLNKKAVDTTVFEYQGTIYLLTFYLIGMTEKVEPHIFKFVLGDNSTQLIELLWKEYDKLKVRGAGPTIKYGDHCIRPAQISQENRYGDGLIFYDMQFKDDYYIESEIIRLYPNSVKYKDRTFFIDGLHTYSSTSKFEVIDIRGGTKNYLKPLRKLSWFFHKKSQ